MPKVGEDSPCFNNSVECRVFTFFSLPSDINVNFFIHHHFFIMKKKTITTASEKRKGGKSRKKRTAVDGKK